MGSEEAYRRVLASVIGIAYEQQLALEDHIGDRNWSVDLHAGTITFGADQVHQVELLGSASDVSQTWLWGWANESLSLPDTLVQTSKDLSQLGWDERIGFLTERTFPLAHAEGMEIALLAAGLSARVGAFYRGPYEGGAAYFLLTDAPPLGEARLERVTRVITETTQFDLPHGDVVSAYLRGRDFDVQTDGNRLDATHRRGSIQIEFGSSGRLSSLSSTMRPDAVNAP